jgi:hypothetical protein
LEPVGNFYPGVPGKFYPGVYTRVLAGERNPNLAGDLTGPMLTWWGSGHGDYVTTNTASD